MTLIDGVAIANLMLTDVASRVRRLPREITLAAVLAGGNPGLKKFVGLKKKAAERAGIQFSLYEFDGKASEREVLETITWLSKEDSTDGILIELPLPKGFPVQKMLDTVSPDKDVDALTTARQKNFYDGDFSLLPPAVAALRAVLKISGLSLAGKRAVVFGQGMLIGKPITHWLKHEGAIVTIINEYTSSPEKYSREADIIVSGVGKPNLVCGDMVEEGVAVFDFGYERLDGRMVGDVNFEEVSKKASLITPVPGGMGPVVIATVLENLTILSTSRL